MNTLFDVTGEPNVERFHANGTAHHQTFDEGYPNSEEASIPNPENDTENSGSKSNARDIDRERKLRLRIECIINQYNPYTIISWLAEE